MSSITIAHILIIDSRVHYLRKLQEEEEENCGEGENHASPLSTDRLCRRFSLAEIKLATRNFDESLVVGKGGFGKVYKGIIDSGATTVAIKRLDFGSKQGAPEFWTEIQMLSKFRHSHLVSLIGYCNHPFEMILVYQYMSHGSLDANLHRIPRTGGDNASSLSWVQRLKICIGAARGLNYLHTGTGILHRVIHRDVKSSNILLDDNLEAKISDFGLSKIGPTDQTAGTHVTTHVKGTFGYLDPEYFLTRKLTRKSDVYAFGVILFEILCGRPAVDTRLSEEQWGLAFWSKRCIKEGKLLKIVDPNLRGSILSNCLNVFAETACQCLHNSSKRRPTMAEVVSRLEYALALQEGITPSGVDADILSDAEGYENQDDADPSTETEAKNAGHSEGQTVKVMQFGGASRSLPQTTPVKGMSFLKMVRVLFSAKAPIISAEEEQLYSLYSHVKRFSLSELQIATQNFSDGNIVGRDGFGKIYKGCLDNGSLVAIKRNIGEPTQTGLQQFLKQVEVTSLALHRNILQLLGFCATATERILVYPYMPNGCVASYLRDRPIMQPALDWRTRKRIALGSARGLAYLHDDCVPTTIHRDVKIANIFLDKEFEVVIGGFGFFKTMDCKNTHVTTAICGTVGHLAPEYLSTGKCSPKTDVFGYGIMLLELITGQRTFDLARLANDEDVMLLDWVKELQKEKMLERLVDADLQGDYVVEEVEQLLRVALLCARNTSTERPKMSEVVNMLQDGALVEELQHTEKMFNHSTPYTDDDWILRTDSIGYLNAEELSSPSRPVAVRLEGLYQ